VQILLVNLATDGLPAVALGVDAPEAGIMRRKPRPTDEGILTRSGWVVVALNAAFIALAVILAYLLGAGWAEAAGKGQEAAGTMTAEARAELAKQAETVGRTMAFVTLAMSELWRAFASRSRTRNLWQIDPRTNPFLGAACLASAAIVAAVVLIPPVARVCGNTALGGREWLAALGLSLVPVAAYETWKLVRRLVVRD
jgi:Ca2+-transporting ATPase